MGWGRRRFKTVCLRRLACASRIGGGSVQCDRRADAFRYATNPEGDPQMPKSAHVVYHELITQMDDVHAAIDLAIDEIRIQETELDQTIDDAVARDRT